MKHISILVPETAVIESIADPSYLFRMVNEFLESSGKSALFKVQLVGLSKEVRLNNSLFSVHPDQVISEVKQTDLIFIPALSGSLNTALSLNKDFLPWIVAHYHKGAEVASLCIGAFLLASTGLLKGKQCSTHWLHANEFREMFPDVTLVDGSIITEEQRLYSSGGANSYWNLLLYLVEKYTDRNTAILASKFFAIDIDRESQSAFMMFQGQKDHEDLEIRKVQEFIESNYQEKITVDQLAEMSALGRRSFERRFSKATNNTVVTYIQRVKIEAAKRSFESSRKNVTEVMYDVGYTDTKAFRDVFKKITGLTPIEYRNKYNKQAVVS
ncbi:AraC family transcriptional regulator [Pedobacter sp. PACM 27299]|uniref:GlxA family transcriptional regulator n=1 Tax=Pedobacter sp. PACM 27299 TaxID=1727164 RepID=UPI000706D612|nr:helix-turn-helix domain-containing protein [Pedobacter sp. PACM 27299]ALL07810.1 AraC family transcriptional regulator [Pedobacter sp. PACM 27299]